MEALFGLILMAVGLLLLLKPGSVFGLHRVLYARNAEPTKLWLIVTRVSGVLVMALGVLVMLYA